MDVRWIINISWFLVYSRGFRFLRLPHPCMCPWSCPQADNKVTSSPNLKLRTPTSSWGQLLPSQWFGKAHFWAVWFNFFTDLRSTLQVLQVQFVKLTPMKSVYPQATLPCMYSHAASVTMSSVWGQLQGHIQGCGSP